MIATNVTVDLAEGIIDTKVLLLCYFCSGGQPYSYCGFNADQVCCFIAENAEPVGILPTPSKSLCGRKGFDGGNEGEADMGEWPWHVRNKILNFNLLTHQSTKNK